MASVFNLLFVRWIIDETGLPATTILVIFAGLTFLVFVLALVWFLAEFHR